MPNTKDLPHIVAFPRTSLNGIAKVGKLEIVFSSSDKGAASHALARKVSPEVLKEKRGMHIGMAINTLRDRYGSASKFAYEIPSVEGPDQELAKQAFMADEISQKRGGNPSDHMQTARDYLTFYNSEMAAYTQAQ